MSLKIGVKKKPDLKNLKLFGCKAYAKTLGPLRKLDKRSKSYVFVGYAPLGYQLWDPSKRKIIVARDVKFVKNTRLQGAQNKVLIEDLRRR